MDDIQPLRNFLKEIQGKRDFMYTHIEAEVYAQLAARLRQTSPADARQQQLLQKLLKQLQVLTELILDYEQEINEAIKYMVEMSESGKRHLKQAFSKIKKTEQEVQILLTQLDSR